MVQIEAFRGLRYNLGHVGCLSDVVAPPYDVIGPQLQAELYRKHPANVVRLILNREEPGDDEENNRYTRAARFLRNWQREGVLQRDPDPAVYVYHQSFDFAGQRLTRRGFMARVRLERFGEGHIYPHEQTHAAAKEDRLKLLHACRANLSQVFGIYPDPDNQAQSVLERAIAGQIPVEATDHLGVVHRLWTVTDVKTISELAAAMGPRPLFIADGHHRYETACNYRDQRARDQALEPGHPAHYVLMMCVGMSDPGMIVLPTHRLFRGLPFLTSAQLIGRLDGRFDVEDGGHGADRAAAMWDRLQAEQNQTTMAFFTHADQRWTLARLNETGRLRMAEVAHDRSAAWQSLGVSVLHRLVVETLLGAAHAPEPKYVHLIEELVEAIRQGEAQGERYPLAVLVMPASLEDVQTVSKLGERMPPKSTYFYPKLLSGLVINPLE
mgnify:CR=1 FL=1